MKKLYALILSLSAPLLAYSQSAMDAYMMSQQDLRGTARYMSMGGAFGALGGDLSVLSQNPGGIGVYRSNDIGFTLDLSMDNSQTQSKGSSTSLNNTKFYLNNIGAVATLKLNNKVLPNINLGFTYNKAASFNKKYRGGVPNLPTSLSNYIAGIANDCNVTESDLRSTSSFDPYNPSYGYQVAPWSTILAYDSYLISPEGNPDNPHWFGQFGNGTSGNGYFDVSESGCIDEYNIAVGGNINNVVFWGMDFGITSIDYKVASSWAENLKDAYVYNPVSGDVEQMSSNFKLSNNYRVNGTGFNYKIGVIVKPIQQLRIGLAFHTPTYYKLTETYYAEQIDFRYPFTSDINYTGYTYAQTNNGNINYNDVNFRSPSKLIASIAGVIGSKFIISADYECDFYKSMHYSEASYGGYDPWWDYDNGWNDYPWYSPSSGTKADGLNYNDNPCGVTNTTIKSIYRSSNSLRVGAEFRPLSWLSLRAGYSFVSSPFTQKAKAGLDNIPSAGTIANYRIDNDTNYVTCGVGFKYKGFYTDLAYVFKHMSSDYYAFAPDPADTAMSMANSSVKFNNSQVVLSMGIRF